MSGELQRQSASADPAPVDGAAPRYSLCLYVSGMTPRSTAAIARLRAICDKHIAGNYDLEIFDIYQQPALARINQVVATPTLIKKYPAPFRRLVGNLSDSIRVLAGLNLPVTGSIGR